MKRGNFKLGSAHNIAFSPDGRSLATLGRKLTIWDVAGEARRFSTQPLSHLSEFVYSPNGRMVLLKNTSGQLALVDAQDGHLVRCLDRPPTPGHDGCPPVFSPCGKYVVDGEWEGRLSVYSVRTGRRKFEKQFINEMINGVMFLPGGGSAYVLNNPVPDSEECDDDFIGEPYLNSWKWPFWESIPKRQKEAMPESGDLACSETGKHFACVQEYDSVCVFLNRGRKRLHSLEYDDFVKRIQWSADGQWLAVATGHSIDLRQIKDFSTSRVYVYPGASDFAFSPDGKWVAIAAESKSVIIPWSDFIRDAG